MTISSTTRIAGPYIGNGTASVFGFAFKVFAAADLDVVRLTTSTGVETTLVLSSDYTVTLNGDQNSNPGGSVTLIAGPLATGFTLTITSDIANLQPTDLTNQGGFYPEVITDSFDRATIQIQQMAGEVSRSMKAPISDGSPNMELPTAVVRANSFLAFDANGLPTVVTSGSSGAPTTITRQVFSGTGSQDVFTLASDPGALGNSVQIYIGGLYQQRSTYTIVGTTLTFSQPPVAGTDNIEVINFLTSNIGAISADLVSYTPAGANAVARSAKAKFDDVVSVKDFGAVGNGVTDDTTAFTNAVTAAGTRNVFVPGGSYKITGTVTGSFYSDATVTIVTGTVNTINRIGSVLSTTGAATVGGNLTVSGTAATGALTVTGTASVSDNVVILTAGKGIDFSATTSGSGTMTSELLNDYEEGTWSPVFIPDTGTFTTMTMDVVAATYTKIGRQVTLNAFIQTDNVNITGGSGACRISGLPFTSGSLNTSSVVVPLALAWGTNYPRAGVVDSSSTNIRLSYRDAADGSDAILQVTDMTTGATANQNQLYLTAIYFT